MTTRRNALDPVLRDSNIEVEPELLLEPDREEAITVEKRSRMTAFKARLSRYGNRVLESARRLNTTVTETVTNIGTALAGSIVFLPLVILARGFEVISNTLFSSIKPLILSLFRLVFDLLRGILWPVHEVFVSFNKYFLFPVLKRVQEDDTAALVAFVVLVALIACAVFALSLIF